MFKNSLSSKALSPILFLGTLVLIGAYFLVNKKLKDNLDKEILKETEFLISNCKTSVETSSSESQLQRIISSMALLDTVEAVYVVAGKPPKVIGSTKRIWFKEKLKSIDDSLIKEKLTKSLQEVKSNYLVSDDKVFYTSPLYLSNLGKNDFYSGAVLIILDISEDLKANEQASLQFIVLFLLALLLILITSFLAIHKSVLKPISDITKLVSLSQGGERKERLSVNSQDEISMLSQSFNSLLDNIETNESLLKKSIESEQSANKAKSEFLANMSHEIRTPLTSILGYTDLAINDLDSDEVEQYLETIKQNGHSLLVIINDILDLSKIEAGKFTIDPISFSLRNLLEGVYELMKVRENEKNNTLTISISENLPEIIISYPTRVRQVLINLIGNALKFTENGTVHINAIIENEKIMIDVVDSGIGMTEEQTDKVFGSFNQADNSTSRKFGGTGLGLTISKRLAEILGGDITIKSELAKGSTFKFCFDPGDYKNASLDDPFNDQVKEINAEDLQGKLLLVEDNKTNRFMVKKILKKSHLEIHEAENGLIAYEKVITAEEPYDLVLMDMQMPIMSGYEATEKIRKSGHTVPIIALTANVMKEDCERSYKAGCDDYSAKPIDKTDLFKKIYHYLNRQKT